MLKILIPIDFYFPNIKLLECVALIEKAIGSIEIYLLHTVVVKGASEDTIQQLEETLHLDAKEQLIPIDKLINTLFEEKIIPVQKIMLGDPIRNTINYSKEQNIDLIVMGRHHISQLERNFTSSFAIDVLQKCNCPIILIPEMANLKSLTKIAYASDLVNVDSELQELMPLIKLLRAEIHVLHIFPDEININDFNPGNYISALINKLKYNPIYFNLIMNNDITQGLKEYLKDHPIDLMVLFSKKEKFNLTGYLRTISDEATFSIQIPFLLFPER